MKKSKDDYLTIFFISIIGIYIFIALAFPMYAILSKSVENKDGIFIGFENYQSYFSNPALVYSIYNSLFISIITMVITISLAFVFSDSKSTSICPLILDPKNSSSLIVPFKIFFSLPV